MTALKKPLCGIMAFILVFAFVFATPISVFADDETTERPLTPGEIELNKETDAETGFEYIKIEAGSAIEIVGYSGTATDVEVPKKIGNLSVVSIGVGAFEGNTTMKTVELNTNILTIKDNAFKDCTALVSIDNFKAIEEIGVSAFEGCTSLASFKLPDAVTTIPERCFANCTSLNDIEVHKNIKGVANDALVGSAYEKNQANGPLCLGRILYSYKGNVKNIVVPEDISIIEPGAFLGNTYIEKLTLGYDVEEIGDYAFQNCTNLTTIEVNDAMGIIGDGSFKGCSALKAADFSNSTLAYIGYEAFSGCTSLTEVKLSETTSEIGDYAFADTKIETIEFGKNINSVGVNSFLNTSKLKSFAVVDKNKTYTAIDGVLYNKDANELIIFPAAKTGTFNLPKDVWKICDKAFYGSAISSVTLDAEAALEEIGASAFENSMITSFVIPAKVTKLNANTFKNAAKLATVTFNEGITEIGASAFEGCAALKTVTFPETLYTVANSAFKNAGLESLNTGNGVAKIYTEAFAGNTSLKSVVLGANVETISADAFSGCSSLAAVELPASLKNFDPKAFSGCMSLATITVSADNKDYKAIDNAVYTADGKTLVMVGGAATDVIVAEGTEIIAAGSFDLALNALNIQFPTTLKNIEADALNGTAWMKDKNGVVYAGPVLYKVVGEVNTVILEEGITSIADGAVKNESVEAIQFVDTVTYIGVDAFAGSGLKEVVIPDAVTYMGTGAFKDCKALANATLPAGITEIVSSAFKGCEVLTDVIIPVGVKVISTDAFAGCIALTGVDFGTVEVIKPYAFSGCTSLANVILPAEIDVVDGFSFYGCTALVSISVAEGSKKYKSTEDGVLLVANFDEEKGEYTDVFETIALYPAGKAGAYAVPAEIKHIADRAFYNCDALTEITFSDGFLTIGVEAFFDCDSIKSVNMPASTEEIKDHAFASCGSLVEFIVNSNLTWYAENAFEGCDYFTYEMVTINAKDNSALFIIVVAAVLVIIGVIWALVYKKKQKKIQQEIIEKNKAREELEAAAEDSDEVEEATEEAEATEEVAE